MQNSFSIFHRYRSERHSTYDDFMNEFFGVKNLLEYVIYKYVYAYSCLPFSYSYFPFFFSSTS